MALYLKDNGLYSYTENPPVADQKEQVDADQKAMAYIALTLEESQLQHVTSSVNAKAMWDTLKTIHQRAGAEEAMFIQKKFRSLKYSGSMRQHLDEMLLLKQKSTAAGREISKDDFVTTLLSSLPDEF